MTFKKVRTQGNAEMEAGLSKWSKVFNIIGK